MVFKLFKYNNYLVNYKTKLLLYIVKISIKLNKYNYFS